MNCCYIFGALDCGNIQLSIDESDIIIAADAGLKNLKRLELDPDYIVGDFDSLDYTPEGNNVIKHPVMKNETDTILAIDIGFEKGYKKFIIYGCIGGRLDHTYANVQTAAYVASRGGNAIFCGDQENFTVIENNSITFSKECNGNVSVFAHSCEAKGVTEEGLLYVIENATLSANYPLGVSNEFIGKEAHISTTDGTLCIIWNNQKGTYKIGGYEYEEK